MPIAPRRRIFLFFTTAQLRIHFAAPAFRLLLMLLFLTQTATAQKVEQLSAAHRPIIQSAKSDTARITALIDYAMAVFDYSNDSTYKIAEEAMALSQKAGSQSGRGRALEVFAKYYLYQGNFIASQQASRTSFEIFKNLKDSVKMADMQTYVGFNYIRMAKYDSAVSELLAAIALIPARDSLQKAYPYNGLALAFANMSQIEKGLYYLLKSEQYYAMSKDTVSWVKMILNRSNFEGYLYRYHESGMACREVIALSDHAGYAKGQCMGRLCLGGHYGRDPGKLDSALYWLRQAESYAEKFEIGPFDKVHIYFVSSRVYYNKGEYGQALTYTQKALDISGELGLMESLVEFNQQMAKIQIRRGDKKGALQALENYVQFRDSLQRKEMATKVNELETKYRTLEKDKALAEQQLAITKKDLEIRKKNLQTALLGGSLLLVMIAGGGLYYRFHMRQQLQLQRMLLMKKESELKMKQASMEGEEKERARIARNLHDGAGSILSGVKLYLSSLENQYNELSASSSYHNTLRLLNDAVAEIRDTSHNLMPRMLFEEGLDTAAADYCAKLGRNQSVAFNYQSVGRPTRYDPGFELMVYRMMQELLGNVMKHAEATQALVQLEFGEEEFAMTVEDDGKGMASGKEGAGIGLYSLKTRAEAFRGSMDVDSSAEGTSIHIRFPVPDTIITAQTA